MKNKAKFIKKLLRNNLEYVSKHPEEFSVSTSCFIRRRKWHLYRLLLTMLRLDSGNLHNALYNAQTEKEKRQSDQSSVPSFVQQRDKLKEEALIYIFEQVLLGLARNFLTRTYLNYFILACDGSDFPMPSYVLSCKPDAPIQRKVQHRMLHLNALYDVLNHFYVAVSMEPKLTCNERDELLALVQSLKERNLFYPKDKTIITCDRGYEGRNVFANLLQSGYHFIVRAKKTTSGGVLHGLVLPLPLDGAPTDTDVTIQMKKNANGIYKSPGACKAKSKPIESMTLRVVVANISNDTYEYLITDLPREKLSSAQIVEIYRKRWDIEVSFRNLKYSLGAIVFHSKKLKAQKMELYASLTMYNCVSVIVNQTNIPRQKNKNGNKKISFSESVPFCIDYFLFDIKLNLENCVIHCLIPIRPGRSFIRNISRKPPKEFHYRML